MRTCIDIGGTKVLIANVDDSGKIVESYKFKTPSAYPEFLKQVEAELAKFEISESTVVVGVPAKINRETGSCADYFGNRDWEHVPIAADISKMINRKVVIENDANLAGLGEYYALDQPRPDEALYVTISTGIGTGFVKQGKLDPDHLDSEGGHMLLERGGKLVSWESIASGKSIVAKYDKLASEITSQDDWKDISRNIAIGFVNIFSIVEPDVVIIGGGVGSSFELFKQPLQDWLQEIAPKMIDIPPIIKASQPEEAVILGAYQLSKQLDD